uniref:Ig-like domain-containing protein n=1 Tax=Macrostomum lignano TaxID=282301 RepID=A0A1I8F2Y4_9PLAT
EISVPKQLRYGASVQFACWSYRTGAQEIDLNWSRGLRQSKSLEFVTMPDGSRRNRITCRFKLDNVTLDDGGNYTCVKTLMSNNQVLGQATAALGKLLGPLLSAKTSPPTQQPETLLPEQQYYSPGQETWRQQQQKQLLQQQQRLSTHYRGSKTEGVILNDAGPSTTGDRQRPSSGNEVDFSYSETNRRHGSSGRSTQSHKARNECLSISVNRASVDA